MNNEFTYKLMHNLPHPPKDLIDLIDFDLKPDTNNFSMMAKRELVNWRGYTGPALRNMRRNEQPFQSAFDTWIKENITTEYQNSSLMYCHGSGFAEGSRSTGAHTDFTRDYVLLYNLRVGGDQAELAFWKEKGHDLVRERATQCCDFRTLELVDSVKGPSDVWYLVNTRILHSTENLDQLRLNLQISFDREIPGQLL